MKKLLSLITISTLSTSVLPTANLILNTKVLQISNKNNMNLSDIPFIKKIKGLSFNDRVTSIATSTDGTVYVGSYRGLYKSTDGENFKLILDIYNGITTTNLLKIANDGSIYFGTKNGLYKSTDGENFKLILDISPSALTIANDGSIYFAVGSKLYKSTDGVNFKLIWAWNSSIECLYAFTDGTVYIGLETDWDNRYGGLYISKDGCKSFSYISSLGNRSVCSINFNKKDCWVTTPKGLYKSTDGVNFNKISATFFSFINFSNDGTVYAVKANKYATGRDGLYISKDDGKTFNYVNHLEETAFESIAIANDSTIYVGGDKGSLYNLNLIKYLLKMNTPDYVDSKGFVYNKEQVLEIKEIYLKNANLDGADISLPSKSVPLKKGKHNLTLTVKDEYKQYIDMLGGNGYTGQITYNFWIKTSIDPNNEINYKSINDDNELLTGLTSNSGNTHNSPIIQTRSKEGTGIHASAININLKNELFNFKDSYFVPGIIDENNNFEIKGSKQNIFSNTFINENGIYHLHLVDLVGNEYDSYLELGQDNWKLKGTFNDKDLIDLSEKLNVTVNLTTPPDKQQAMAWLQNYQAEAEKALNKTIRELGKGFWLTVSDLTNGYKDFLDPIIYRTSDTTESINSNKLNQLINKIAEYKLKEHLNKLPQGLNVDTSNAVNKLTLDSCTTWITNYQDFIMSNKDTWINNILNIAGRGYANEQEIQHIKDYINGLNFSDYLKRVVWKPNMNLSASSDYNKFIQLDKLQSDTIDWVNKKIPDVNKKYQNALNTAISSLNLHGYTEEQLLNGKQIPQTKSEIENFEYGISYHDWLQTKANNLFKGYQIKMGLGIGIPLSVVTLGIGLFLYWSFSKKYKGYSFSEKK